MNFEKHLRLKGSHAILGASNYHWLNYTTDKFIEYYNNIKAKERGTRLHNLAAEHIDMGISMPRNNKTINKYINDAIGYNMTPEQPLWYTDNCFGTADAISLDERKGLLRIHDLKTGVTPASMKQLLIYMALLCLEYGIKPGDIEAELRIYQNDDIMSYVPQADEILPIMDKMILFNNIIDDIKYR